jgi:hypothetical protein
MFQNFDISNFSRLAHLLHRTAVTRLHLRRLHAERRPVIDGDRLMQDFLMALVALRES